MERYSIADMLREFALRSTDEKLRELAFRGLGLFVQGPRIPHCPKEFDKFHPERLTTKFWAKQWPVVVDNLLAATKQKEGQRLIFCDNLSFVTSWSKGRCTHFGALAEIRRMFALCQVCHIDLRVRFLEGTRNPADPPSRHFGKK